MPRRRFSLAARWRRYRRKVHLHGGRHGRTRCGLEIRAGGPATETHYDADKPIGYWCNRCATSLSHEEVAARRLP